MKIKKSTRKETVLEMGKACNRCGNCCKYGSAYVLQSDVGPVARKLGLSDEQFVQDYLEEADRFNTQVHKIKRIRSGKYHGSCVFYDRLKGCLVNSVKPLHCRISTCTEHGQEVQDWFVLNHFVNPDDPESLRQWSTILKLRDTIPGGQLSELLPDPTKLKKILNYEIVR